MTTISELTLAEELLLLGLDPARGKPRVSRRYLRYGLAAALLAELETYGALTEERGRIVVLRPVPTGRPMLDQTLGGLAPAAKGKGERVQRWLRHNGAPAERLAADSLAARGAIRQESHRVLGLFPSVRHHLLDRQLHDQVLASFQGALKLRHPEPRDRALAGLALGTDLAARLGVPLRVRRELKPLVREQWFAKAVQKQVSADKSAASNGGGGG